MTLGSELSASVNGSATRNDGGAQRIAQFEERYV